MLRGRDRIAVIRRNKPLAGNAAYGFEFVVSDVPSIVLPSTLDLTNRGTRRRKHERPVGIA